MSRGHSFNTIRNEWSEVRVPRTVADYPRAGDVQRLPEDRHDKHSLAEGDPMLDFIRGVLADSCVLAGVLHSAILYSSVQRSGPQVFPLLPCDRREALHVKHV